MATKKRPTTSKSKTKVVTNSKANNKISWYQNRWTAVVVVVAFAIIGTTTLLMTRAATATGPITGIASKCLDNSAAKVADGNKIQLWGCNNTVAQKWSIPGDGTLRVQGYCLDVRGAGKKQETPVQLYHCNNTVAQKWKINADGSIVNPNSGLCLDDKYAATANGTAIWLWKCNGTVAQKWTVPKGSTTPPAPTPTPPTPTPTPNPQNPNPQTPTPTPTPTDGSPIGQALYVSPSYAAAGRPAAMATQPIAEWYGDWIPNPTAAVKSVVDGAAAKGQVAQLVAYNIPHRDCGSYSAGGAKDAATYKTWIRNFAAGIGQRKAIVIIEPDALAQQYCLNAADQNERYALIADAVSVFAGQTKAYVYIDAAHSAWGGISIDDWANRLSRAGIAQARGFSTNVSNFQTTANETAYGNKIAAKTGKTFVIDTSRNGQGPVGSEWCNPEGRGLGKKPTTSTGVTNLDAYLWIKRAGESDGACGKAGAPAAGQWFPAYAQMLVTNAKY